MFASDIISCRRTGSKSLANMGGATGRSVAAYAVLSDVFLGVGR